MGRHSTFGSLREQGHRDHAAKLRSHTDGHHKTETSEAIKAAVHKHEKHDHPGTKPTKLKSGGHVEGAKSRRRLDRASGGRTDHHGGKKGGKGHGKGNQVNIVVAGGGDKGAAPGAPGAGAPMMAPKPPMAPPMMPPPAGGPPGAPPGAGAMPPRPPMAGPPVGAGVPGMHARGGRTGRKHGGKIADGAMSGPGRLEKMETYGKKAPAGENHGETEHEENRPAGSGKSPMKSGGAAAAC